MENKDQIQIDLNRADFEHIMTLPGIGQSMAERIIAGRPYREVEELLQIQGLGKRTLERIYPFLTLDITEDDQPSGSGEDATLDEDEDTSAGSQTLMERLDIYARTSMEKLHISSQVVGFVLITATISVVFSVILSLTIITGINRTLNFGRHTAVREIRSEMSQMDAQLKVLAADMASVDQRLQAVEGLSGRMAILEAEFELINDDVDQAMTVVDQLTKEVNKVSLEVEGMTDKVNLFDGFLNGIRVLVSDLFEPVEITPSP
jgi:competence protein ComEA